jgi:hypothetical protein
MFLNRFFLLSISLFTLLFVPLQANLIKFTLTINFTKQIALPITAAFLAASVFSSCSKEVIDEPVENMEYFYYESCGLTKVEGDSIIRFVTKVDTYVTHYPETKSDPYYPEIVDNINEAAKHCGLSLHINLNLDWEGVEDITIG